MNCDLGKDALIIEVEMIDVNDEFATLVFLRREGPLEFVGVFQNVLHDHDFLRCRVPYSLDRLHREALTDATEIALVACAKVDEEPVTQPYRGT